MKHLISLFELSVGEVEAILDLAADLKQRFLRGERPDLLKGHVLTQVFEKPSLRTRSSFDAAIVHLGGSSQFLSGKEAGFNGRETLPDIARVMSCYSDAIVLRTFSQQLIEEFAGLSRCPVINGLSDDYHPCQALTDIMTIREVFPDANRRHLVYIGDANNVAMSLATITCMLGMRMTIAAPPGYALKPGFVVELGRRYPLAQLTQTQDPRTAVRDADIIYTDVWASMGQEAEADQRKQHFQGYQVNAQLMSLAPQGCRFMHDLPARRGTEVTDEVIDGPASIVFQQAENRMHLAKGLLVWLLRESRKEIDASRQSP